MHSSSLPAASNGHGVKSFGDTSEAAIKKADDDAKAIVESLDKATKSVESRATGGRVREGPRSRPE
jgi:hypothetical protein